MRKIIVSLAALALLSACSDKVPTAEEEALPETGSDPEVTANSAAAAIEGNATTATPGAPAASPGGPVSDQGSGSGDTASGL